jgi:NADP-reducing hydrogenase subunit HndD
MKLDDMGIENKPGGCRVCVVEVKEEKTGSACVTEADNGMLINTIL